MCLNPRNLTPDTRTHLRRTYCLPPISIELMKLLVVFLRNNDGPGFLSVDLYGERLFEDDVFQVGGFIFCR